MGWDPRDKEAFEVCAHSLKANSSIPLHVNTLTEWRLRQKGVFFRRYVVDEKGQMWDHRDGRPFSTQFSFTRFCVPALESYGHEWVLFCDPDMLWCADVAELFKIAEGSDKAVFCVQHEHAPCESSKMAGLQQTVYRRKNWSSLMLMRPDRCDGLTVYAVNNQSGSWLHGMCWVPDEAIGALPESWNWLEGWSDPNIAPNVIHFTRGTPDLPGCENVMYAAQWHAERAWLDRTA